MRAAYAHPCALEDAKLRVLAPEFSLCSRGCLARPCALHVGGAYHQSQGNASGLVALLYSECGACAYASWRCGSWDVPLVLVVVGFEATERSPGRIFGYFCGGVFSCLFARLWHEVLDHGGVAL